MRPLILALLFAFPAAAEEVPLTPDQLLDRLVGTTAAFTTVPGDYPVGIEYFPSRTRSFWQPAGGYCVNGKLTIRKDQLCFRYEDEPEVEHCWTAFEEDGGLFVRADGSGQVQRVRPADGLPFDCVDGLIS
ncbi:hypothetical protein [Jannaschia formosa]|uniref:hypothetical protein n=1 Tax=Jannaschia formosa TaxID=2259592 RepID=UPI000E1BC911|nr:hypothetical protein [Jannaschia formosa]TFL19826.1 hypothetical protein DR046_00310 [Jannaschia formosa]